MLCLHLAQVIGRARVAESFLAPAFAPVYGQDADIGLRIDVRMLPVEASDKDHNGGERDPRPLEAPEKPRKANNAGKDEDVPESPNNLKYLYCRFHSGKLARVAASAGVSKVMYPLGSAERAR